MSQQAAFKAANDYPTLYSRIDWRTELPGQETMVWGKMISAPKSKRDLIDYLKPRIEDGRMTLVEAAHEIASYAHAGETRRRGGEPYMEHVLRVYNGPETYPGLNIEYDDFERALALVHDVLETKQYFSHDNWTSDDFRELGYSEEFVENLEVLTRDKYVQHYLLEYIQGLGHYPRAAKVKLVDNLDNYPNSEPAAAARYEVSIPYLTALKDGRIKPGTDIQEFAKELSLFKPEVFSRFGLVTTVTAEAAPK